MNPATNQGVFFPETGVVRRTGEPEPDLKEKMWLHTADINYEIRLWPPPHQGHVRVIHIGFSSPFAWVLFMMPHHIKATMVIADPR